MFVRIICSILFIALAQPVYTQTVKQFVEFGDESFASGDYYGASIYYKLALKLDSASVENLWKYAESLRMYNNYQKAAHYYQKVLKKERGKIYPMGPLYLAQMHHYNGDYRSAMKAAKKATSVHRKRKKEYPYLKARQEIASCAYALRTRFDTTKFVAVKNAGEALNTTESEFGATYAPKGIYFSSQRANNLNNSLEVEDKDYKVKIYYADSFDNVWFAKKPLDTIINKPFADAANGTFSLDGNRFYFTRCLSDSVCHIYYSQNSDGRWSEPNSCQQLNSRGFTSTQPSIAQVGKQEILFFASTRPGGYGKLDVWYSVVKNGNIGSPKNVGEKINSIDNEITPFYDNISGKLYFSSNWHKGLGGFDVFYSLGHPHEGDKGASAIDFSAPQNAGQPINTSWNDFYFTLDSLGVNGFLTSNRVGSYFQKGPTCCNDIYQVNMDTRPPKSKDSIVTLDDLNKYLPVTLFFHNDEPDPRTRDSVTRQNYLTTYRAYKTLQPKYREEYTSGLDLEKAVNAELDIDGFFKHYVDKGVDDLTLFTRLLLEELRKGQRIDVTVKGFASPLAKTDYNVKLTGRRISSLVNYLREYDNGVFRPYLDSSTSDGGQLSFTRIPFGEYVSNQFVSDNLNDRRNSVYSKAAGLERKIEVISVRQALDSNVAFSEMTVNSSLHDFGKIIQGDTVSHVFTVTNSGNKDLIIDRIEPECGCTIAELSSNVIAPGQSAQIRAVLNSKTLTGKIAKSVIVRGNSFPSTRRLVVVAEVFVK